jgi:hypothetical protein
MPVLARSRKIFLKKKTEEGRTGVRTSAYNIRGGEVALDRYHRSCWMPRDWLIGGRREPVLR